MIPYPTAAAALVMTLLTSVSSSPSLRGLTSGAKLNTLAQENGKIWFGTAADIPGPEQEDLDYMTILNDTGIFGQLTPANYMKASCGVIALNMKLIMLSLSILSLNKINSTTLGGMSFFELPKRRGSAFAVTIWSG
jgi:hypothetical protein